MYLPDNAACSEFSSESPMPADWIASQDAYIASVGRRFTDGNRALNELVVSMGGNPPAAGGFQPGNAGVPTRGRPLLVNPPGVGPGNPWLYRTPAPRARASDCPPPAAAVALMAPIVFSPPPTSVPAASPIPAGPAPARRRTQAECRTGNICRDLRDGCVAQSQLSPQQVYACSASGWVGNRNLYPDVLAYGSLPYLGDVDLNPPQYAPGMGDWTGPGPGVLWGSLAAGAFVVYLAFFNQPRGRRRR
jgi:hypothetical protein